ncbi:hypothetical protein C8R43DRAFT_951184 [Mycena crocata]|nr:hypothetical protein C8R43DRAFT_951184 [Mycena crocata]
MFCCLLACSPLSEPPRSGDDIDYTIFRVPASGLKNQRKTAGRHIPVAKWVRQQVTPRLLRSAAPLHGANIVDRIYRVPANEPINNRFQRMLSQHLPTTKESKIQNWIFGLPANHISATHSRKFRRSAMHSRCCKHYDDIAIPKNLRASAV